MRNTALQPTIEALLRRNNLEYSAAEIHGLAAGMLCLEPNTDGVHWLEILQDDEIPLSEEAEQPLLSLFSQTRALLDPQQGGFDFDLLLPGDDQPLDLRIDALRSWCQGFLYGLGYNSHSQEQWPSECQEILRDLVELTKIDADFEDDSEDNAAALVELHEYVRAAVLMMRDYFLENAPQTRH